MNPTTRLLLELLALRVPEPGRAWAAALSDAGAAARFTADFAAATRRAGQAPLAFDAAARDRLRAAGVDWSLEAWGVDDLARVAMLCHAADRLPSGALTALVEDANAHGDTDERRAVLLALPLLPDGARFVPLAVDACRTNVRPLFEAIACDNPFAARHFPEAAFNQLVLKAIFLDVPLARVVGLGGRRGAELRRMASDYAQERRSAGRAVSADLAGLAEEGR